MQPIRKLLVPNRGEIAIRIFRAANEIGIATVAVYSKEDRLSLHRSKADEAYPIGQGKSPVAAYLDIDAILDLAQMHGVDAVHPGYGFLPENAEFARRCQAADIRFVGPPVSILASLGDKTAAHQAAEQVGIPTVPGTPGAITDATEAQAFARTAGFPLLVKAVHGGGGRGMRVVRDLEELQEALEAASREAGAAFGRPEVFLEKYLEEPKHIEVQVLFDSQGHGVHLFERDCSIQRRHQKVIEIAPAHTVALDLRRQLADWALALMQSVGYVNAGTMEFLVSQQGELFQRL